MWKIKILSPAKINLHLDISPPGANGFHPLRSLFVMVSLYDEMRIEEKDEGCVIISDLSVHEKENILYKTWLLCQKEGLYKKGLKIHLKKKNTPWCRLRRRFRKCRFSPSRPLWFKSPNKTL
jgi:4-diphosphocytidyl-2-C-methyl-D-erythritol kinase